MSRRAPIFWVIIAALLTFLYWIAMLNNPFTWEPHAFASAHMALMARSFAHFGIVHLRGVPIMNNPPLGVQPDRYIDWPPLYPILLSVAFRMFGESEAVVHVFVIVVNICYMAAFYCLVRRCFDRGAAIFSLFALLTIPVFIQYGRLVWTPNVAMCAVSAALYCFVRGTETALNWKWVSAGAAAVALGVLFSWEAAPLGFILLGLGMWQRSRIRQVVAATYAAAGLGTVAIVLVLLVSSSPELRNNLWVKVLSRMGWAYNPHSSPLSLPDLHLTVKGFVTTMLDYVTTMLDRVTLLGGTVGLLATMGLVVWSWNNRKNRPDVFFVVGGLLGIVVVWVALFPQHVFYHDYQALIAAPLVCISLGVTLKVGSEWLNGAFRWMVLLLVPLILIVPLILHTAGGFRKLQPDELLEYAKDIESNTPASAVVLSPSDTMVTVYYSHRHIILYVHDDEEMRSVTRQTETIFPGSDIYIAIPPDSVGRFSCASSQFPLVKRTRSMILLKVSAGACAVTSGVGLSNGPTHGWGNSAVFWYGMNTFSPYTKPSSTSLACGLL